MRVVFLVSWLSTNGGGIWEAGSALAAALAAAGTDVTLLGPEDERTAASLERVSGVPAVGCPPGGGPARFGYGRGMLRELRRLDPDVVHVHGLWRYHALAALLWHRRTRRPMVVSPHGGLMDWALAQSTRRKAVAGALFQRAQLRASACVHALTDAERLSARAYGARRAVAVIPNGVDPPAPAPPGGRPPPWRASLPADARVLLFFGRLSPQKGVEELLRAWHLLTRAGGGGGEALPGWHLVIAGWGDQPYEGQVRSLAAELGVARCLFAGPQFHDDRAATYRAADAFILPSVCEGLPMAALEAWSFGRPALMTEACNLPQGFRAGAALPLPPPARTEELAAAIRSALARGPDELAAAGERGAALARDEFAWPGVAARFAGLYGWIVRGGPAPACVTEA